MVVPDVLIEIAWKTLAIGAVSLVLLRCLGQLSAHKRALIGHGGVVAALLLIPLTIWGPAWTLDVPAPDFAQAYGVGPASIEGVSPAFLGGDAISAPVQAIAASDGPTLPAIAATIYACIALFFLLSLAVALAKACTLGRRSVPVDDPAWLGALAAQRTAGIAAPVDLRVSVEISAPISVGLWRPMIVLDPETLHTPACAQAVLGHELAHVASQDWGKLLLCRFATAVLWFNPMIWILARTCAQLREEAADDMVLRRKVRFDDYASLLISVASRQPFQSVSLASGLATRSSLKRRLVRILAQRMDRAPAGATFKAACLAVVALAVPFAALTPTAAATATATALSNPLVAKSSRAQPPVPSQYVSPSPAEPASTGHVSRPVSTNAGNALNGLDGSALPPISAIQLYGWAEIRVRQGSESSVRVIGGSARQTMFSADQSGRLSVMACTDACPPANLVLEVTTPTLPSLGVTGGGAIKAQHGFPAQRAVRASVMGGGVVDVSSVKARSGRVDITSGGSVIADPEADLETNIVDGGSVIRRASND